MEKCALTPSSKKNASKKKEPSKTAAASTIPEPAVTPVPNTTKPKSPTAIALNPCEFLYLN